MNLTKSLSHQSLSSRKSYIWTCETGSQSSRGEKTSVDLPYMNNEWKPLEPKQILAILDLDHPGATDPEYRTRREQIARLAQQFRREPNAIPLLEYTPQEHATWKEVNGVLSSLHPDRACGMYLRARKKLHIPQNHIPQMRELSHSVSLFNGMRLAPIEGLVDSRSFLISLANKRMLCTQYIRHHSRPTFTPEPDAIHEFIGHVPTFADADLVEFTRLIGQAATEASEEELKQLERLYWFTLEYGMIEEHGNPKAFGAGLLAGIEDMNNAFRADADIRPFTIEEVINTDYNYSFLQQRYFVISSFEFLKEETKKFIRERNLLDTR